MSPGFETSLPAGSVQGSSALSSAPRTPDPLAALYRRSRYLAACVELSSRRRDCRALRAALLLAITSAAVPAWGKPRARWQVQGAMVGQGPELLRIHVGQETGRWVSSETVRRHLVALERAGAIVRAPGEVLAREREAPGLERFYRRPDTIHVLTSPDEAQWWAVIGFERLAAYPEARTRLSLWRRLFARWRDEARCPISEEGQVPQTLLEVVTLREARDASPGDPLPLDTDQPRPTPRAGESQGRHGAGPVNSDPSPGGPRVARVRVQDEDRVRRGATNYQERDRVDAALAVARAVQAPPDPLELLEAATAAGAPLSGKARGQLAARPSLLRYALAAYALELRRGQRFTSPSAWILKVATDFARRPRDGPAILGRLLEWARHADSGLGP
jgi:hypothetical protein